MVDKLLDDVRLVPRRVKAGFKLLNPPRFGASSYLRLDKPNSF